MFKLDVKKIVLLKYEGYDLISLVLEHGRPAEIKVGQGYGLDHARKLFPMAPVEEIDSVTGEVICRFHCPHCEPTMHAPNYGFKDIRFEHGCHCTRNEDKKRIAWGICCARFTVGASLMREEDYHDKVEWREESDCTCSKENLK